MGDWLFDIRFRHFKDFISSEVKAPRFENCLTLNCKDSFRENVQVFLIVLHLARVANFDGVYLVD